MYLISSNLTETQAPEENVESKPTSISSVVKKSRGMRFFAFLFLLLATLSLGFAHAEAAEKKKSKSKSTTSKAAQTKPYAAIVVDAQTGEVLMARQADSIRHPASLTKIMTLYMLFEAIEDGRLRMNDTITISSHAASMSPSKLGLPPGRTIRVEDAIGAIVTKSANDVAAAVAEKLGGSERAFCNRMTRKAHDLGMTRTTFRNASGLPDPQQVTSARDMAKLAMAMLRDYPQYYHYFGIRNFEFQGQSMRNHNRLLGEYPGLDGIKTGYINASGFNLVASAKQNGRRLVGVVFGGRTWKSRNDHMVTLLDEGFAEIKRRGNNVQVASAPAVIAPIPLPPPMADDFTRGPEIATSADETDSAEDAPVYSDADTRTLEAVIDRAQEEDVAANLPIPAPRPAFNVNPTAAAIARPNSAATDAALAAVKSLPIQTGARSTPQYGTRTTAPTVMQLRLPRSQVPSGIPSSQIASAANGGWSIQVGAFQSRAMTDQALRTAQSRLPNNLQHGQPVIVPQNTNAGMIFRARLQGYDELSANAACAHLGSCLVVAPGS